MKGRFSKRNAEIFWLIADKGLSYREIADKFDLTQSYCGRIYRDLQIKLLKANDIYRWYKLNSSANLKQSCALDLVDGRVRSEHTTLKVKKRKLSDGS